jgi:hypothetical protein
MGALVTAIENGGSKQSTDFFFETEANANANDPTTIFLLHLFGSDAGRVNNITLCFTLLGAD